MDNQASYNKLKIVIALIIVSAMIGLAFLLISAESLGHWRLMLSTFVMGGFVFLMFKMNIWRESAVFLIVFTLLAGIFGPVPRLDIVYQSIRNLYFHVPMWFGMIIILTASVVHSIKYLKTNNLKYDTIAAEMANTGILFGVLGIITGMVWANATWGTPWSGDPKQNSAAIGLLVYFAYLVLRGALPDDVQKARISSIYNIFAFPILVVLLFVLPRMAKDSLHPGMGGNPGFGNYDLQDNMRIVFYPAIIGWTLVGVWITQTRVRIKNAQAKLYGID